MKVEVLFPEVCCLYGELANIRYLKESCSEAHIIETTLNDIPAFESEVPDLIYMGTMTEKSQLYVIEKLRPYRERLEELIESGARFLITGNALEVFGEKIEDVDGTSAKGLGIFHTIAKRDMLKRFNSLYLGTFEPKRDIANNMKIVGFKSQFAHSYWSDGQSEDPLFTTERGPGLNPGITGEGIRKNNFMATYVIGPLLILNPPFAKYILQECGGSDSIAFEEPALEAYELRVEEYSDPATGFYY